MHRGRERLHHLNPVPLQEITFSIEEYKEIAKLASVHENIPTAEDAEAAALGWAAVGSNLKTLLETGNVLPQVPRDMHAQIRDAQMHARD